MGLLVSLKLYLPKTQLNILRIHSIGCCMLESFDANIPLICLTRGTSCNRVCVGLWHAADQLPLRSPGLNGNADGEEIKQPQPEKAGVGKTLMLLFSPELKVTTLLSWSFFFANYFTYYGLVLLTTQLAVKSQTELHGFSDSTADSCLPDGKSGMDISTYKSVLITCFAELPGLIVACLIVERLGRKASLGLLLFGCGICMIPLWTLQTETVTLILMFGARSCIMGAFSILWAFAPELYPTKVRSTGLGFCNSGGRLGGFLCPFVAVGLVESGYRVRTLPKVCDKNYVCSNILFCSDKYDYYCEDCEV